MSFPELLEAVKSLPTAEKIELMNTLAAGIRSEDALIGQYLRPGAVVHIGWQVTTDEAGWQVLQQALAELKAPK